MILILLITIMWKYKMKDEMHDTQILTLNYFLDTFLDTDVQKLKTGILK